MQRLWVMNTIRTEHKFRFKVTLNFVGTAMSHCRGTLLPVAYLCLPFLQSLVKFEEFDIFFSFK